MVRQIGTEFETNLTESKGHAEGAEDDAVSTEVSTVPPATFNVLTAAAPRCCPLLYATKPKPVLIPNPSR